MDARDHDVLLSTSDLWAGYGELTILKGIEFSMRRGEIVCVIGANGAGKSTLLKTLFGEVPARAGHIYVGGDDVTRLGSHLRLHIGVVLVPQGRCNFPRMTVRENLEMGGFIRSRVQVRDGLERVLSTFPVLADKVGVLAGNMSGGEQQLLEMGMALMLDPRVILIDEPSLGLSHAMQRRVFDTLHRLAADDVGVLLVEQNAVQALEASDRGLVVEMGQVAFEGSGVEMLEDQHVRQAYLGLES